MENKEERQWFWCSLRKWKLSNKARLIHIKYTNLLV